MYRVLNKFSGKTYGDFETIEEAEKLENEHIGSIVCDLSIPKEIRKKRVQKLWNEVKASKTLPEKLNEWIEADQEYIALYNEDY